MNAAQRHGGRHHLAAKNLAPAQPATTGQVHVRVIGAPAAAEQAAARVAAGLLHLDRRSGPHPARTTPGLVRIYLTGRLRPPPPPSRSPARHPHERSR